MYKNILISILVIGSLGGMFFRAIEESKKEKPILGVSFPDATWTVIKAFSGYETKSDPSKVSNGANPMGQNTTANNGDRISIRNSGYELFPEGTASTSLNKVTSLHTFRKRSGENIMMRAYGTVLEYYEEDNDEWTTIKTGLSDDAEFDFADYNINTDLKSYVYFGNAVDPFSRWTGAHSITNGAIAVGDSTITVDDTTDGFNDTGSDKLIYCGTEVTYSSKTNTVFTLTASTTVACADNQGVTQSVQTYASNPKGNIYLVNNNRLFIAGIASTSQAVYFSEYGDATNFVDASLILSTTATAPGIFNLGEGGGAVIAMTVDEESIYFFKKSTIRKATLNDTLYTLSDLKPSDGKSQTIGATNNKGVFTGGNQVYFASPDNQLMSLGRVESVDYPQTVSISEKIKPTIDDFKFDDLAGIVFRDKAYFSAKATSDDNVNNVVMVWDIKNNKWDSPIVGWSVSSFTIYNDGTSEDLYIGDVNSPNVYKVTNEANDGGFEVVANWRSKQFDFDLPHAQKEAVDMYVDGYIAENTTMTVSLLFDEDGYSQIYTHDIHGTDDDIIYDSVTFNAIGLSAFGIKRFGSQDDLGGKKKFRVYLGKSFRPSPFYNIQVEFSSDGESQDWEVLNIGFKVRPYSVPEKSSLYQSFK